MRTASQTKIQDLHTKQGSKLLDGLQTLVTKQTGPAGKPVNTLYIANKMKLKNEMYFALLLDRGTMGPMIIACSEGARKPTCLSMTTLHASSTKLLPE